MIANLSTKIPLIRTNDCIHKCNSAIVGIYDDENKWCIIDNVKYNFRVTNPQSKDFWFLAIDKCCLDHTFPNRRCDFGIVLESEHLYLIEIKDTKAAARKMHDPIEQLESTIKHFRDLNLLEDYEKRSAIMCYKYEPELSITETGKNTAKLRFLLSYKFKLLEGNHVEL